MRLYSSFLVRCWLTDNGLQGRQSVFQVEHIQTGASTRAEGLSEVEPWIFEACRTLRSDYEIPPPRDAKGWDGERDETVSR